MTWFRNLLMSAASILKPRISVSSPNIWVRDGQISEVNVECNTSWIIR